ncbi:MAG: T9SS type A sorting domain-containing protein [Ignavibacteria bacterium]|nr:T9SS type A sorting domain-containing protein [Ignavibacteria bacterium]
MKTITCNGYAIIIFLSIILTSSLVYSQSTIVYDAGTSIDVGTGADVCADSITVNGTYSGNGTFCNAPVSVENEDDLETPKEFNLSQNYPNPFNPSTVIKYAIPTASNVKIEVFNITGEKVSTLVDGFKNEGYYEVEFSARGGSAYGGNASGLASGLYLYRISAGTFIQTKKMILLR